MENLLSYIIPAVVAIFTITFGYSYIKSLKDPNRKDSVVTFWRRVHFGKPLSKEQKDHLDNIQKEAKLPKDLEDKLQSKNNKS